MELYDSSTSLLKLGKKILTCLPYFIYGRQVVNVLPHFLKKAEENLLPRLKIVQILDIPNLKFSNFQGGLFLQPPVYSTFTPLLFRPQILAIKHLHLSNFLRGKPPPQTPVYSTFTQT